MDINNLQAFIEVADKKSFSRSAESLKLTQPAVSKRIAALESELASRLFDRVGRRVHLTEAGHVLLPSALKISSEVARIESEILSLGKEVGGKLSIGVAEYVSLDRLAPILKSYKQAYPDVDIDLQFVKSAESLDAIEGGLLDMTLCTVSEKSSFSSTHSRLAGVDIWTEELKLVVDASHPLAMKESVTVQDLALYPGVLPQKNSAIRQTLDQLMIANNVEVKPAMEVSDFPTTRSMASIGMGWACLPLSEGDDSLTTLNTPGVDVSYSVALVRNPDRSMSRAAQAFVDTLPALLI